MNGRGELSRGDPFLDESLDGCSSFVLTAPATGDGYAYCGQNWDWRAGASDTMSVSRVVPPPKPRIIKHTMAGQMRLGLDSAAMHEPLQAILRSSRAYRRETLLTRREEMVG